MNLKSLFKGEYPSREEFVTYASYSVPATVCAGYGIHWFMGVLVFVISVLTQLAAWTSGVLYEIRKEL